MPHRPVREITESGFKVSWPAGDCFRLAELGPYQRLSGKFLKEMDVGWYDSAKGALVLLELKGAEVWTAFNFDADQAHNHLISNLVDKASDVLLILGSVWARTEFGNELAALLPEKTRRFPGTAKLKLQIS